MQNIFYLHCYRLFTSLSTWIFLALSQIILAWLFVVSLNVVLQQQSQAAYQQLSAGATDIILIPIFKLASVLLLIILPFFTAQMIAGEKQQHTWPLLKSAPYSLLDILLAKFLTLVIFAALLLLQILLLCLAISLNTTIDSGIIFTSSIGFILNACTMIALGLFISSFFQHAIKAAITSLFVFIVMANLHWLQLDKAIDIGYQLSWHANLYYAYQGILSSQAIIYFVSCSVLFLTAAYVKMESE